VTVLNRPGLLSWIFRRVLAGYRGKCGSSFHCNKGEISHWYSYRSFDSEI